MCCIHPLIYKKVPFQKERAVHNGLFFYTVEITYYDENKGSDRIGFPK